VILENAGSRAKQVHTGDHSAESFLTDSFINAGLQIDAFNFGETFDCILNDFWFLHEALDVYAHAHQLF
jgi:hypothetical protein